MNGNAQRKIWLDRQSVEAPRMGSFSSRVSWPDSISKTSAAVVRVGTLWAHADSGIGLVLQIVTRPDQIGEITLLDRTFVSVREFSSMDHVDEPINDATAATRVEQDQESDSAKGRVFEAPTTANKRIIR